MMSALKWLKMRVLEYKEDQDHALIHSLDSTISLHHRTVNPDTFTSNPNL